MNHWHVPYLRSSCVKFVLVNWTFAHEGVLGGCESFHEKLASVLRRSGHTVDFVSYREQPAILASMFRLVDSISLRWKPPF